MVKTARLYVRKYSPFLAGTRVRNVTTGRVGTVVAIRDEWPTVGAFDSHQAVEVAYDENDMPVGALGYQANWRAIRPWSAFEEVGSE